MSSRIRLALLAAFALCSACTSQPSLAERIAATPLEQKTEAPKAEPKDFSIEGFYSEACSCSAPCPCELTGPKMSCKGVGAYQFDKGKYGSDDFSGCRLAYSLYIGKQVQLYIDAPDATKAAAMEKFARVALAAFGPITGVHQSKVELSGKDGAYTIKVDGGKVMNCTSEPMLGGDKKTPVVHSNTFDALNPVMYQAQCLSCTYVDGEMKITLEKGNNSYFNAHMKASGKL
jgi:hypothetical protein